MTDFVDPEELPFTVTELFEACRRFMPIKYARETADHLAECGPDLIAARAERREGWRAAGIPGADTMLLHGWVYPDELLPALASISADAEARARGIVEPQWEGLRRSVINTEQHAAAERAGLIPTREEIARQARRAAESRDEQELLARGLVVSLPELPPPSAELDAAAAALVARKRSEWEMAVTRFRRIGADE